MGGAIVKGVLGAILVIAGLLLTLTGVGAFPGLPLMFAGLMLALWGFVGERRRDVGSR